MYTLLFIELHANPTLEQTHIILNEPGNERCISSAAKSVALESEIVQLNVTLIMLIMLYSSL
jgi:hypothetical protein